MAFNLHGLRLFNIFQEETDCCLFETQSILLFYFGDDERITLNNTTLISFN